jgi:excisionase family DNA binding protein
MGEATILLRVREAAELLSLGESTVKLLIRKGELPVVRCGRAVRVPRADLDKWVEHRSERRESPWLSLFREAA